MKFESKSLDWKNNKEHIIEQNRINVQLIDKQTFNGKVSLIICTHNGLII